MLKSSKNKVVFAIIGIVAILIVCIFSVLLNDRSSSDIGDSASEAGITMQHISGLLPERNEEDLISESTLVVHGKICSQSEAFKIIPVFGDSPSIFTDYYVEIYDVLRGEVDVSRPISVRVQGGIVGDLGVEVEDAPALTVDDEVVLFLYQPNMGSAYNTEGDYYYVVGLSQGAYFKKDSSDTYSTDAYSPALAANIDLSEFEEKIEVLNEEIPVDENIVYDTFIENLDGNLETGFITQEEYKTFVAETYEYATIID